MQFSGPEQTLLSGIQNDNLRDSLKSLRRAMVAIWANDAPRIIKNFTDHGEKHCERIAGHCVQLLRAKSNQANALSEYETYLLLGGIYLHDIGMQCDVVRFPEIKDRSRELGARFEVDFDAELPTGYTIEEQKAIRENHHYLSAAWIECARRGIVSSEPLNQAAMSIPVRLVKDLMDICQYHSKLPITECPIECHSLPGGRKQLVAALLRLADELDIDSNRVNIETIRLFSFDPANLLYWWLHNVTDVNFTENIIQLVVQLHSQDARDVGDIVRAIFIDRFEKKNAPVVGVLHRNGFRIELTARSDVLVDDFWDPLPKEILDELRKIAQKEKLVATPRLRILLVEDSIGWRNTLGLLLKDFDHDVEPLVKYGDAIDALLRAGARSAETEIAVCVTDLSLEGTPDNTWEGKGVLALCQVLRIPTIVVSENLEREPDLTTQYGVMKVFKKSDFSESDFTNAVQGILTSRANSATERSLPVTQRQPEMLAKNILESVVYYYQVAIDMINSSVEHSVSSDLQISPSYGMVDIWQRQIRDLNQRFTSIIEEMRQVYTFDELNALHPKVLDECRSWLIP